MIGKYLLIDVKRGLLSRRFFIGSSGVFITMVVLGAMEYDKTSNVITIFYLIFYGIPSLLILVFSAVPYADSFSQDYENNYILLQIARGNLPNYTASKVMVIYISSILSIVSGVSIYIAFLHIFLPWTTPESQIYQALCETGGLRYFLYTGHFFIYFMLYALQYALMAGDLCLLAACLSLYIPNTLLVWAVPVMSFYFISYFANALFANQSFFNPTAIFNAGYNVWKNDIISYSYALLLSLFIACFLYYGILNKIKRKVQNE